MQEKNMGHICPIGRSGVINQNLMVPSKTISPSSITFFKLIFLKNKIPKVCVARKLPTLNTVGDCCYN